MGAGKEPVSADMVEAVVARGRTVIGDGGKTYGPGKKVKLAAVEAQVLRELGYLVDPDAPEIPVQQGPKINPSEGPSTRLA